MTAPELIDGRVELTNRSTGENATRYEIAIGPRTVVNATKLLEQQLGAVWQGIIEAAGGTPEDGWQLVIDRIRLVRQEKRG